MKVIDHIPDEVDERDRLKRPWAVALSIVHALIGSKISVALANKVVGAVGGLVVLAGLIFLVYIVHAFSS